MRRYLYLWGLLFMVLFACKAKQITNSSETLEVEKLIVEKTKFPEFEIQSLAKLEKEDLLFHLLEAFLTNQVLELEVQYGGGCIKPHEFVLVSDGIIDENGLMKFYLLHKTHDDHCKALIIENLSFDLKKLYQLDSERLSGILLNEVYLMNL